MASQTNCYLAQQLNPDCQKLTNVTKEMYIFLAFKATLQLGEPKFCAY